MHARVSIKTHFPAILACLLVSMFAWTPGHASDDTAAINDLVQELIALRGEVDELDSRLQILKEEHQERMASLAREAGQLDSEKQRQQLQLNRLEQRLESEREAAARAGVEDEALEPVLREAIAGLRTHVETALPFKRSDRLDALDEMEKQLDTGSLPTSRVANRLWSFISDEVRLSTATGLYRQPVTVDGEDKLVDVARLGMMQLYFRTDDGRPGYAARTDNGWRYRYAAGGDRDRIHTLMDDLRKQIRTGYFELPNPDHAGEMTR